MTPQLMQMINGIIAAEEAMRMAELHEMSQSHIIGLQGFKRFHRYNAMDRGKHSMMLRCHMTEYHHSEPQITLSYDTPQMSGGMLDSLKAMYDKSKAHIEMLSTAMKMAFDEGETLLGDYLGDLIKDEAKEAERYYRIWLDVKRDNADLNALSHELHEKMKKKEKKYFNWEA